MRANEHTIFVETVENKDFSAKCISELSTTLSYLHQTQSISIQEKTDNSQESIIVFPQKSEKLSTDTPFSSNKPIQLANASAITQTNQLEIDNSFQPTFPILSPINPSVDMIETVSSLIMSDPITNLDMSTSEQQFSASSTSFSLPSPHPSPPPSPLPSPPTSPPPSPPSFHPSSPSFPPPPSPLPSPPPSLHSSPTPSPLPPPPDQTFLANCLSSPTSKSSPALQPEIKKEITFFDKQNLKTPPEKKPKKKEEMSPNELFNHKMLGRRERIQSDSENNDEVNKEVKDEEWEE